jgi:MFS transporter, putative metabolite:H+ symporter
MNPVFSRLFTLPVLVCTLGYMVDAYDMLLLTAVRIQSLTAIGIPQTKQLDAGILLINAQMLGLVLGGIAFGILGDKFGRTRVLFASIGLYSIATFANAFIANLPAYAILRFLSGFGLAGELGLAMTLLSEIMDKRQRGYAAAVLAGFGVTGCILAGISAQYLDWRHCFMIGGLAGLVLLILRTRVIESTLFCKLDRSLSRGNLRVLFQNGDRIKRFLLCTLIATPIPLTFWMLIAFASKSAAYGWSSDDLRLCWFGFG